MGYGNYSVTGRLDRATKKGYKTKSAKDIFAEKHLNSEMNPKGVVIRESRDSDEHPESVAIMLGLDVTGTMGTVPHYLVKDGLPTIVDKVMENGLKDPQILFMGVGDHRSDRAPLQISQFESSDELMDKWLTTVYLEGGGGRNGGESYFLPWYFASRHTSIDCLEKRNKKGILITIGDEPTHPSIKKDELKRIMGKSFTDQPLVADEKFEEWDDDFIEVDEQEYEKSNSFTAEELLKDAQKMYDVYHIHIAQTRSGKIESTVDKWDEMLGDNLVVAETREDVPGIISDIINSNK